MEGKKWLYLYHGGGLVRVRPMSFVVKIQFRQKNRIGYPPHDLNPECKRNSRFFNQPYIELVSNTNFVTAFSVKERASFSSTRAHAFSWRERAGDT